MSGTDSTIGGIVFTVVLIGALLTSSGPGSALLRGIGTQILGLVVLGLFVGVFMYLYQEA